MAIRAKAPTANIQSDGLVFTRSMSSAVKMFCGYRPVRQPGARLREWKGRRRG
jgi:hypothetical protein